MDRPAHDLFFGILLGLTIGVALVGIASLPSSVSTGDWAPVVRSAIAADQRWGTAELSAVLTQKSRSANAVTIVQVGPVNLTTGDTVTESTVSGKGINSSSTTIIRKNGELWLCDGGGYSAIDPLRCKQPFAPGYVSITSAIKTPGIYPATLSFLSARGVAITREVRTTRGGDMAATYVGTATSIALNDANAALILHGGDGHQVLVSETVRAPITKSGHITAYSFHLVEVSESGLRTSISGTAVLVPKHLSTS